MIIALGLTGVFASSAAAATPNVVVQTAALGPLEPVPVDVSGGPGNLTDWIGVYLVGAPDWDYKTWSYLGGNGHVPPPQPTTGISGWIDGPGAGGLYEVRFFANDGFTRLATSNAFRVTSTATRLYPAAYYVTAGQTLTVEFSGGTGGSRDWIGVVAAGSSLQSPADWRYLNNSRTAPSTGPTSGSVVLTMNTPGTYEVYYFVNDSYSYLVKTSTIYVGTVATATLRTSAESGLDFRTSVGIGAQVTVYFNGTPGGRTDWIGLYPEVGANGEVPATAFLDWRYTNDSKTAPGAGRTSGSVTFDLPATEGTYQFRFFTNDGYTESAQRAHVITTRTSIVNSAVQVPAGGRITALVDASPGRPTDWLGLYLVSAPDTSYLDWEYLNGTRTPPVVGMYLTNATTFTVPTTPGTYQFRLFSSDGFGRVAVGTPFVVS